jgi:alkylation response protein AidB-like acyl-CoA dehydrogenase
MTDQVRTDATPTVTASAATADDAPTNPHAAALRPVLEAIIDRHRARWGDSDEWEALVDFQRELGAAGWGAPQWPVEIGGRGLGVVDTLACDTEFARVDAPRRIAVFGTNNVGPTINTFGTDEQKAHLSAILLGHEFWCQGFSEPDAGSDLAGLRTRAELTDGPDGEGFVINGQKVWTSIGLHATHCMLLARTDPDAPKHAGISALLVPMDVPGLTRQPIKQINGEAEFAELFFEDVFAPRSALLGPLNEGWRVTTATLGFERAGVISIAGKLVDDVMEMVRSPAVAHASRPLRHRVLDVYITARILQWMGDRALANINDPQAAGTASSLIKQTYSLLTQDVAEVLADLAGIDAVAGLAPDAAHRLLTSRASTIAGGTTEVMKNILGERNLGLPREPR